MKCLWVFKKLFLTERTSSPQEMHQQHKEASTYMNYGGVRNGASTHSLRHNPSQVGIYLVIELPGYPAMMTYINYGRFAGPPLLASTPTLHRYGWTRYQIDRISRYSALMSYMIYGGVHNRASITSLRLNPTQVGMDWLSN